jgi:hypothetical protein
MMYLPHDTERDVSYVFATKAGAPTNPDWYSNLTAAGDGSVECGTETYKVTVRQVTGAEPVRDISARSPSVAIVHQARSHGSGYRPRPIGNGALLAALSSTVLTVQHGI